MKRARSSSSGAGASAAPPGPADDSQGGSILEQLRAQRLRRRGEQGPAEPPAPTPPPKHIDATWWHKAAINRMNKKLHAGCKPDLYDGQAVDGADAQRRGVAHCLSGAMALASLTDQESGALYEEGDEKRVGPSIRPTSTFVLDRDPATGPHDVVETTSDGEDIMTEIKKRDAYARAPARTRARACAQ